MIESSKMIQSQALGAPDDGVYTVWATSTLKKHKCPLPCRYLSGKQSSQHVPAANNPMWQAPEVIESSRNCSKAGDVYSFGIIMFELLMLNRPWPGTPLPLISHYVKVRSLPPCPLLLSHTCFVNSTRRWQSA
jgi:serine/threonine protein kinase